MISRYMLNQRLLNKGKLYHAKLKHLMVCLSCNLHNLRIPWVSSTAKRQHLVIYRTSSRVLVRNICEEITDSALMDVLSMYGQVKDTHRNGDTVTVTYTTADEAQQ